MTHENIGQSSEKVKALMPNRDLARRHVELLTGSADTFVTFQTFDDNKQRSKANRTERGFDPFAKTIPGRLADVWPELVDWNRQGAGVFLTVNEMKGCGTPRTTENTARVRALFVDLDGAPIEPVLAWDRKPSFVIESSRSKFHAYWIVDDVPLDAFEHVQRQLATKFNGDKSVHDLPRVLRLAGSVHSKVDKDGNAAKPSMSGIYFVGEAANVW
jgi:hypothetical protein